MKQPYLLALILTLAFVPSWAQDETLHPWTDIQGRTLQASFISLDEAAQTVTIKWNGQVFPLPLNTLASESQALAKKLGAPTSAAISSSSSSPFDEILDEVISEMPMDALGPEALDIEHDWTSADGKSLSAKFLSLIGDQLKIAMNGGAKEFTVPLSKFSSESQALAKVLQSLAKKHKPEPPKPTASTKPAKVTPPQVVEADLDKMHRWTSADGNSLEASFMSADDTGVELIIRGRSTKLAWSKLDPQSVALAKALQKLQISLIPTILPAKGNSLERYGSGKWKNYNTILESKAFEVGLHAAPHAQPVVHIWMLEDDGSRVQKNPINIRFEPRYGTKGQIRKVKTYTDPPPVSNDRRTTRLKGVWTNDATFEYNFDFSDSGIVMWGEAKESSNEEYPTFNLPLILTSPNAVPNSQNATEQDIKKVAGDGELKFDPVDGKADKFSLNEKWTDITAALNKRKTSNQLKKAEFTGLPFGAHKIRVELRGTKDSVMSWGKPYGGMFPIQGTHIILRSMDGYEATRGGVADRSKFKNRLEITKSGALNVKVYKGI